MDLIAGNSLTVQTAFKANALEKITHINLNEFMSMPEFLRAYQPSLFPVLVLKTI